MIEIRTPDYNDEEYTDGAPTYAVLNIRGIKIMLNKNDLDNLEEELKRYSKPHYCYQCKKFIMNKYGEWKIGGSCCKNKSISQEQAGYENCVDCMNTCSDFEEKMGSERND